ncbi:unnamed protein product [Triticum turgidum subsp. durum]|uniref:F-box domain-containing protein n=1 Tax=Triticum turgidum subsp. durum TaxID=4567 RepID=A0A9R1BA04_TRITD|nr:unnamed protein product [Triticum turgidum subsp. durum]
MDRRIQAPLVDSSACLCRAERAAAVASTGRHVPRSRPCVQSSVRASIHPLSEKRSSRADRRSDGQRPLLPGLPDDLAIACLIRVPRADHCKLRLVCRRWLRLLAGNYFYGLRGRLGLAEQWLYAFKSDGDGRVSWDVLDPAAAAWRSMPPVPAEYAAAAGFSCAVLGGCHLYLLGGRDPRRGAMRRVVFYSARSNRWHRAPDMLRRRHCFGACVMGNRLYVAGGESGGGGLRSADVFDPAKNRWSFLSDMARALVPFVSVVHGGRWYVKGLGAERQVLSQVYTPETDKWSTVATLDSMVTGWRSPSACIDGRLYAADCKDGCRLRAYDEAADAWSGCASSGHHLGSSHALEAVAMVTLRGKLCVVRNDMSVSVVDVAAGEGNQPWETLVGKGQIKSFVTNLLASIAGRGRAKNRVLHCQVLEA